MALIVPPAAMAPQIKGNGREAGGDGMGGDGMGGGGG
jgi:hypothetical protein